MCNILQLKKKCLFTLNILKTLIIDGMIPAQRNYLTSIKYLFASNLIMDRHLHVCFQTVAPNPGTSSKFMPTTCSPFPIAPCYSFNTLSGIPPLPYRRRILASSFATHSISKLSHLPHSQLTY